MIRLHTGVPGAGKTLDAVYRAHYDSNYKGRPIYHHGIEGLDSGVRVYCKNPDCRTCRKAEKPENYLLIEDWFDYCEPTALFIIDEAHRPFPMRASKAEISNTPAGVAHLTESRHEGVDFIVITQNAMFIDIGIRRLVEVHCHYSRGMFARVVYTHNEVMANDQALKFGEKTFFFIRPRKKAFKLYKSAEVHTTIKGKVPFKIWALVGLIIVLFIGVTIIGNMFKNMRKEVKGDSESSVVESAQQRLGGGGSGEERLSPPPAPADTSDYSSDYYNFEPRNWQFPESAPAFDGAIPPITSVPVLKGCIHLLEKNDCRCFDQQGIRYETSLSRCIAFIDRREHDRYPDYQPTPRPVPEKSSSVYPFPSLLP